MKATYVHNYGAFEQLANFNYLGSTGMLTFGRCVYNIYVISLSTVVLIVGINKEIYSLQDYHNQFKEGFCRKYQLKCIHTALIML